MADVELPDESAGEDTEMDGLHEIARQMHNQSIIKNLRRKKYDTLPKGIDVTRLVYTSANISESDECETMSISNEISLETQLIKAPEYLSGTQITQMTLDVDVFSSSSPVS